MESRNKPLLIGIAAVAVIIIAIGSFVALGGSHTAVKTTNSSTASTTITSNLTGISGPSSTNSSNLSFSGKKIQIVAAENFWGSLMQQLGGNRVNVTSIVSDPNADPHEYESNANNARAIANASLVVVNGAGYDDWALKLIAASNNQNQTVLNVAQLLGRANGTTPHLW
jgi:zinc/manganese transport system substrate-binding protein